MTTGPVFLCAVGAGPAQILEPIHELFEQSRRTHAAAAHAPAASKTKTPRTEPRAAGGGAPPKRAVNSPPKRAVAAEDAALTRAQPQAAAAQPRSARSAANPAPSLRQGTGRAR